MDERIAQFLAGLEQDGDERFRIVTEVREIFRTRFADAEETFKYGGLHYLIDGAAFAGIFAYTRHVSVEINGAAHLDDPHGHLAGVGGKSGRKHVRLDRASDVADKRVGEYLARAWELF
ncbi:DUF1801 domain-containing protein [Leucobacter chromiireducens]|uniref:DUF1801 domain-containing protein n=1 Tax=Leucobacter chromiireducens TaxID=283877 RepID=UPI000F62F565|nr:DUF1801 domain-containing protein [Leucobacter chromiireducens]